MKRELIVERLDKTIEMLKGLQEKEFNYDAYVAEYNADKTCGTVCCVKGWYPKFFPEAGVYYRVVEGHLTINLDSDTSLNEYHGFRFDSILSTIQEALFYGHSLRDRYDVRVLRPIDCLSSLTLSGAIGRFILVRDVINDTEDLDHLLELE